MRPQHVALLICPRTKRPLVLEGTPGADGRVRQGRLLEPVAGAAYPIVEYIPRFAPPENYANSFGFEWTVHSRTQHDTASGFPVSSHRFERETRWGHALAGETILEAGCGSGRFTGPALATGATVVAFDYSRAVDQTYRWHGHNERLLVVQASIYEMPFRPGTFDRAFCFGVLQHTPDPRASFMRIVEQLKPGGWIASDVYAKDLVHWALHPRYWVRPFLRKRPPEQLYRWCQRYIDRMWPVARLIGKIPRIGHSLNWRLLVGDHSNNLPGAPEHVLKEWAYLDTFDMLSPAYDLPQTLATFRRWHEQAGLTAIDVHYGFNGIEGRARKPGAG
jgi:SAM-dependent methyltransferase